MLMLQEYLDLPRVTETASYEAYNPHIISTPFFKTVKLQFYATHTHNADTNTYMSTVNSVLYK